ncbi:MAG: site-2 protease family protein, partial [Candidatus Aminicenantes bacterium]|nr:site-2 protease family protein [Candidatus Aminicenantes bacterium]
MEEVRPARQPARWPWLNLLLFFITCISAFYVGLTWSVSYIYSDQLLQDSRFAPGLEVFTGPRVISLALVYAAVLIAILLGHEMGHYLACRHYRIEATLPYFIPAPTLIGTLGAFIRIKAPITRRKQLFDIGIAGPLTGFVLSLPAVIYGLSLSKVVPPVPREDVWVFGEPLLLKLIGGLMFRNIPAESELLLHPVGFAGWVGILITAFNLFPVGQLDGGHISYALLGEKSKPLALFLLGVFVVLGIFFWVGWIVWVLVILLLGFKHPQLRSDQESLSLGRRWLSVAIIIIFILS